MNAPLIFLDIDGVLNNPGTILKNGIRGIDRQNIEQLNILVRATDARIVISSSWRYMILGEAMTLNGFRYMLLTHGLTNEAQIEGYTCSDEVEPERGKQIAIYLAARMYKPAKVRYVVLDDGSDVPQKNGAKTLSQSLYDEYGDRWVPIDADRGLIARDVEIAVAVLANRNRPTPHARMMEE